MGKIKLGVSDMFGFRKRKREEKKNLEEALRSAQEWKRDPHLQECLGALRGDCTVAPMELHEAITAVVNIAHREGCWTGAETIPGDFFPEQVYLLWNKETLPAFRCRTDAALEQLERIRSVAEETYVIGGNMDRVVWFDGDGHIRLYSVA